MIFLPNSHHIPIIFLQNSHHIPITFPSDSHHIPSKFPSYSHFQYLKLYLPGTELGGSVESLVDSADAVSAFTTARGTRRVSMASNEGWASPLTGWLMFTYIYIYGGFLKWGYPSNSWFLREYPIKKDDLGVPLFQETSTYVYIYILILCIYIYIYTLIVFWLLGNSRRFGYSYQRLKFWIVFWILDDLRAEDTWDFRFGNDLRNLFGGQVEGWKKHPLFLMIQCIGGIYQGKTLGKSMGKPKGKFLWENGIDVPTFGDLGLTSPNICWRWNIPFLDLFSRVMWNRTGHRNQPLSTLWATYIAMNNPPLSRFSYRNKKHE